MLRSQVFPPGSHAEITEKSGYPLFQQLGHESALWAKMTMAARLWWYPFGVHRQRVNCEDLVLEAASTGAYLIRTGETWPDYYLERFGEKLEAIGGGDQGLGRISLNWDDELQETAPPGRTVSLKLSIQD